MNMPTLGKMTIVLILMVFGVGLAAGQELGVPQNFMVDRMGDTFDLTWDAPEGPAPLRYELGIRWRATRNGDWMSSSGFSIFDTSASLDVGVVQELGGAYSPLYQVEFSLEAVLSGGNGPTVYATWTAPAPKRTDRTIAKPVKTVKKKRLPTPHTCDVMTNSGGDVIFSSPVGLTSGIQCQHIGAAGIGVLSIIQAGFIDAVDVWGKVGEVTICFKQGGAGFLFLDAATSPRSISRIDGFDHDEMRCTTISGPGSVILMPMIA